MAYTFAEGLVDEVITQLTNNLATKLDTVDTEQNDALKLEDVVSYFKRDPDHPRALSVLPVVFVKVLRTGIEQWRSNSTRQNHILWLYLVCRDTDPERLAQKQYRYGQALWRTLVDGDPPSGTMTWKLGVGAQPLIDYSAAYTNGSIVMADVKLELQYEKLETE